MKMFADNPEVTFEEIAQTEEKLKKIRQQDDTADTEQPRR